LILLLNAIKFTTNGSVVVTAKMTNSSSDSLIDEDWLEVSVKDTGIGISQIDQKKLFKLFEFVKDTSDMNTKGIGLGLVIC
jgi:signal transduction histidine kinase